MRVVPLRLWENSLDEAFGVIKFLVDLTKNAQTRAQVKWLNKRVDKQYARYKRALGEWKRCGRTDRVCKLMDSISEYWGSRIYAAARRRGLV